MNYQKNQSSINDPLYGFISFNNQEKAIIDSPFFQRLRYVKQLTAAEYVFPTELTIDFHILLV